MERDRRFRGKVLASLAVIVLLFAGDIAAQGGIRDPDYGDGTGTTSGGSCKGCNTSDGFTWYCFNYPTRTTASSSLPKELGWTGCTAHNASTGPNGCVMSGSTCYGSWVQPPGARFADDPATLDEKSSVIASALRDAGVLTLEDVANFMGDVEQAIALDPDASRAAESRYQAYRAKWNELVPTMPLEDGDVPMVTHPPVVRDSEWRLMIWWEAGESVIRSAKP